MVDLPVACIVLQNNHYKQKRPQIAGALIKYKERVKTI
jgi:hypothetical protein